jgi:hypothetical protein
MAIVDRIHQLRDIDWAEWLSEQSEAQGIQKSK